MLPVSAVEPSKPTNETVAPTVRPSSLTMLFSASRVMV